MSFGYVVALVEGYGEEPRKIPCGTYYGSYGAKFENFGTGPEFSARKKYFSCFDAFRSSFPHEAYLFAVECKKPRRKIRRQKRVML